MTVLPGFIDTHVHTMAVAEGLTDEAALAAYIEDELPNLLRQMLSAGVTTVLDTGAHFPVVLDVREAIAAGRLAGPRLLAAGPAFSAPAGHPAASICRDNPFCLEHLAVVVDDPDFARTSVAALAEAGVDVIKAVHQAGAHLPVIRDEVIRAMAEEAEARGVPFYVHGTFFSGMVRAAGLGVDGFVHVPWRDRADAATAEEAFASAGIPVATTVSLHDSFVDDRGHQADGDGRHVSAGSGRRPCAGCGQRGGIFRRRRLHSHSGRTSSGLRPYPQAVLGEALALAEVMTPEQVIAVLTRNAAEFLNLGEELGTLEVGKRADMVILDGDPLADISRLANVAVVVQAGRIVVDAR